MSTCVAALYAAAGGAPATTPAQDLVDTWASGGAGSDGFAMVFEDSGGTDAPSIYVKDSGTPANDTDINLTDDFDAFNSFLTYTSPSPKIVRQSDGDLKYCAHNLILRSQEIDNSYWTKSSVTIAADDTTAPDGASTADRVTVTTSAGAVNNAVSGGTSVVAGMTYRLALRAKKGATDDYIQIRPFQSANFVSVHFNLNTGVKGSVSSNAWTHVSSSITSLGDGWYLCEVVFTTTNTAPVTSFRQTSADVSTSSTIGAYMWVWGLQFHRYPADTTYLPTTSAARYALPIQHDSSNNAEGLLVEPAATNLNIVSEWFASSWSYLNGSRDDNSGAGYTDPMGGSRAVKQAPDTSSTTSQQVRTTGDTYASTSTYVISVYAKKVDTGFKDVSLILPSYIAVSFDLDAETSSVDAQLNSYTVDASGVLNVGNGWKRCYMVVTTATGASIQLRMDVDNTGDGTSGILFWGAQVELGTVPTSPIITTGATATRAVDDLNKALTAIEHSATAGTLYAKYVPRGVATSRDIVRLDDGTANEVISIGQTSGAAARLTVTDGGAAQTAPLTSGTVVAASDNKVAASWAANDFAISEGGAAASTDTSGTLPTVTTFDVGAVNGLVKEVLHLPETMSDVDLASITT